MVFTLLAVGVWPPQAGKVTLDGATLDQWPPEALVPSIGYLPQDVQLFDGTQGRPDGVAVPNAPRARP